ncbi:hypothetical protein V6N13_094411 [Hibiscus sabdariffa]|uniref:Uncharacterized protein n=1 Tax=Hibiscus sabdariffa TaxID=183260 RepID=A0ABR2AA96_9ROSI
MRKGNHLKMNGGDEGKKLLIAGTRGRKEGRNGGFKRRGRSGNSGGGGCRFKVWGMSVVLSRRRRLSSLSQLGKRKAFGFFDGSYGEDEANPSAARFLSTGL